MDYEYYPQKYHIESRKNQKIWCVNVSSCGKLVLIELNKPVIMFFYFLIKGYLWYCLCIYDMASYLLC